MYLNDLLTKRVGEGGIGATATKQDFGTRSLAVWVPAAFTGTPRTEATTYYQKERGGLMTKGGGGKEGRALWH